MVYFDRKHCASMLTYRKYAALRCSASTQTVLMCITLTYERDKK